MVPRRLAAAPLRLQGNDEPESGACRRRWGARVDASEWPLEPSHLHREMTMTKKRNPICSIAPLFALLALVTTPTITNADEPHGSVYRGYTFAGEPYWGRFQPSAYACRRTCDTDYECRSWTHIDAGTTRGWCRHYSNVPGLQYMDGSISGIKPSPPAVKAQRHQLPPPPVVQR